ncbi:MAG: hypothetical protein K2G17_07030 [Duncaniella sp.]|nr:hypothetical protein [Duncaniella sp.]
MFRPREIVYGFISGLGFREPKNKYLISLYRDEDLEIVACFTTSQPYYGVPEEEVGHGAIVKDGKYISYVFEKDIVIGKNPETDEDFSFPKRTTVTFDYGIRQGYIEDFAAGIENARTVCIMDKDEYAGLLYAMFKSPLVNDRYKPLLEATLWQLYDGQW